MLDTDTKRRIDTARDILVGKDAEKNLLTATSPFVFSTVNERTILRFFRLIACNNPKIGSYAIGPNARQGG